MPEVESTGVSAATLPRTAPATEPHGRLQRLAWSLETPVGLLAMFLVALGIRIALAPRLGFFVDLGYFRTWASELAHVGPRHFYSVDRVADYPPGYLYVLWLVGKVSATPGYLALKLPAIVADLGIAWVAGTFAARLSPSGLRQRLPVRALVAAAVLFNPAVIALSACAGRSTRSPSSSCSPRCFCCSPGPRRFSGTSARSCSTASRSR